MHTPMVESRGEEQQRMDNEWAKNNVERLLFSLVHFLCVSKCTYRIVVYKGTYDDRSCM